MELPTIALGIAAITVAWLLTFAMMKVARDADEIDEGIAIGGRPGRTRNRGFRRTGGPVLIRRYGLRTRSAYRPFAARRSIVGRSPSDR